MTETTHITSNAVTVDGRYLKQRCVWCGEIIADYDFAMSASSDGKPPSGWECGILITIDGDNPKHLWKTEDQDHLPDSFCGYKYNLKEL